MPIATAAAARLTQLTYPVVPNFSVNESVNTTSQPFQRPLLLDSSGASSKSSKNKTLSKPSGQLSTRKGKNKTNSQPTIKRRKKGDKISAEELEARISSQLENARYLIDIKTENLGANFEA